MDNILKYQNPSFPLLIQRVNQSDANFVKRLLDPNRKSIPDWETKGQKIATHKMSWGEDERGAYVFPEVQEIDGQLIDFSRPPYTPGIADYMAHKNNNIIRMSPEEADWFTRNYKQYYSSFKKGGRIHIKKKNRGKFTEYCGGKVTEECITKGKKSKNPLTRRRANFASVVRKWKHENGGILKAQEGTPKYGLPGGVPAYIQSKPLSPIDIAIKTAQEQTRPIALSPGVKEVIGPDGQKIAIRTEQPLIPLEQSIAEWMPGTGDVAEIGYIADDVKNGNYGSAALAAGLVVVPGGIGTAVHKARQLPPLDKIRDNRLRELVEYVQNFGVEKLPFETYLELDDALRYADIGLKGNRKRVQNIVKRVTDDIEKYYDDFRAARANARSTKPTPIKDDWKEPFDEMRPMKSFGHRAKTTHKRGGML